MQIYVSGEIIFSDISEQTEKIDSQINIRKSERLKNPSYRELLHIRMIEYSGQML